jgi:hypothetical protein
MGLGAILLRLYTSTERLKRVYRSPEPEFLNIYWRLKSRLFEESCLFKGQSVQQGSQWLQFFVLYFKDFAVLTVLTKIK